MLVIPEAEIAHGQEMIREIDLVDCFSCVWRRCWGGRVWSACASGADAAAEKKQEAGYDSLRDGVHAKWMETAKRKIRPTLLKRGNGVHAP